MEQIISQPIIKIPTLDELLQSQKVNIQIEEPPYVIEKCIVTGNYKIYRTPVCWGTASFIFRSPLTAVLKYKRLLELYPHFKQQVENHLRLIGKLPFDQGI